MKAFPHVYAVTAAADVTGNVSLLTDRLPELASAAPLEFDGPGDQWSPEGLLGAAVAGCFILTFRAVARASRLRWTHLTCNVEATLARLDGLTQFTRIVTRAVLTVPVGTPRSFCERILTKAEEECLIANSLRCRRELKLEILTAVLDEPLRETV
jgi:organic hydroperoxide reductase OsmC/OhrA